MGTVTIPSGTDYDILCFSHLRWDFVFQRPQHLLTRFARDHQVYVIEEPIFEDGEPRLDVSDRGEGVTVVVPKMTHGMRPDAVEATLKELIDGFIAERSITNYISWYYTPMMSSWTKHLKPRAVVFDVMDELSAFKNAPQELLDREKDLFRMADVVFTGGRSLYESKKTQHDNVHCFPSSIDVPHFAQALTITEEADDQAAIPHPRIGFFGVIDERTDIELLREIATMRPDWHLVMIGPVVKIDESDLPRNENIHYLGGKDYKELPKYIAGWDVAMMPFAINESTKFISPTKTPEYLAAGRPVVSTAIADVVDPYGKNGLTRIAETPEQFVAAIGESLKDNAEERRTRASKFLGDMSWDKTQQAMSDLISKVINEKKPEAVSAAG